MKLTLRTTALRFITLCMLALSLFSCSSHRPKQTVTYKPVKVHVDKDDYLRHNPCKLDDDQYALVEEALGWLGTPYAYARDEKGKGTDCSGLTLRLYLDVLGVKLPRNSAKQAEACKEIDKGKLRPGDLVFFATGKDPERISHVGMMLTDDEFIHASSRKGVVINSLSTPYYTRTYLKSGRVRR